MADGRRELLQRFHGHLHDAWRRLALSVPGGWVEDSNGLTCIAARSSSPSFNLAMSDGSLTDPQPALDRAVERFRRAKLSWLLKLQPDFDRDLVELARRRGVDFDEEPVFAMSTPTSPATPHPPTSLSIVTVGSDRIGDAVWCFAEAFDADPGEVRQVLGPNLLSVPTFTVFVAYLSDEPVATAMLATTRNEQLAGVYSVATRPPYRGRGFGTAITAAALLEARAQGYETAVLEPSPMGEPMYRRMGFEQCGTYLEAVM